MIEMFKALKMKMKSIWKNLIFMFWININSCALSLRSCTGVAQNHVNSLAFVFSLTADCGPSSDLSFHFLALL